MLIWSLSGTTESTSALPPGGPAHHAPDPSIDSSKELDAFIGSTNSFQISPWFMVWLIRKRRGCDATRISSSMPSRMSDNGPKDHLYVGANSSCCTSIVSPNKEPAFSCPVT